MSFFYLLGVTVGSVYRQMSKNLYRQISLLTPATALPGSKMKSMTARLIHPLICAVALTQSALSQSLLESVQSLNQIEKSSEGFNSQIYLKATAEALLAWEKADEEEKRRFASQLFGMHFRRSQIMASAHDYNAAAAELSAEAALQKDFEGRLEFTTKSPDSFFRNLVELQAQLTAEIGRDPLMGQVGYSFQREGEDFIAARFELGVEIAGTTVPEVGPESALVLVHRLSKLDGKFVAAAPRWLVVAKGGRLPDVLKQATVEIVLDSAGRISARRL